MRTDCCRLRVSLSELWLLCGDGGNWKSLDLRLFFAVWRATRREAIHVLVCALGCLWSRDARQVWTWNIYTGICVNGFFLVCLGLRAFCTIHSRPIYVYERFSNGACRFPHFSWSGNQPLSVVLAQAGIRPSATTGVCFHVKCIFYNRYRVVRVISFFDRTHQRIIVRFGFNKSNTRHLTHTHIFTKGRFFLNQFFPRAVGKQPPPSSGVRAHE